MKLSLNTHQYDGEIGKIYHQIVEHNDSCADSTRGSFNDSICLIRQWLSHSHIKDADKAHVLHALHLLTHDRARNHDDVNQIDVEELLPRVIEVVKKFESDGIDLFLQTLGEISQLGPCPQGRTTRLLNFYIPWV